MARYRKIDTRIHGDEKFRKLTRPKPCGQALWLYLIAPREATNLPGVIVASEAGLANNLGWSLQGLRKVFSEIIEQRMVFVDWTAQLLFLPNAIKYHEPESPNVIRSWRAPWDEVPECKLKGFIYNHLRNYITANMGEAFLKAFMEALPPSLVKDLPPPFGESGAGVGVVTGVGVGTDPVPIHSSSPKLPSVPEQQNANGLKPESGNPNGNGKEKPDFMALWGPVEGFIRKQVVEEAFNEFYRGIRIIGLTSNFVELAVPQAFIEARGPAAARDLEAKILESKTGLLRGRMVKLISIEQFIEQELS